MLCLPFGINDLVIVFDINDTGISIFKLFYRSVINCKVVTQRYLFSSCFLYVNMGQLELETSKNEEVSIAWRK